MLNWWLPGCKRESMAHCNVSASWDYDCELYCEEKNQHAFHHSLLLFS